MKQIGPIVDKQPVRRQLDGYEEEEYPDRSGPDLYRAMRGYPRMGPETGADCNCQIPDSRSLGSEVQLYVTGAEIRNVWKFAPSGGRPSWICGRGIVC